MDPRPLGDKWQQHDVDNKIQNRHFYKWERKMVCLWVFINQMLQNWSKTIVLFIAEKHFIILVMTLLRFIKFINCLDDLYSAIVLMYGLRKIVVDSFLIDRMCIWIFFHLCINFKAILYICLLGCFGPNMFLISFEQPILYSVSILPSFPVRSWV